MPYKSEKQRRFVKAKAAEGAKWAKSYAKHSDNKPIKKSASRTKKR